MRSAVQILGGYRTNFGGSRRNLGVPSREIGWVAEKSCATKTQRGQGGLVV